MIHACSDSLLANKLQEAVYWSMRGKLGLIHRICINIYYSHVNPTRHVSAAWEEDDYCIPLWMSIRHVFLNCTHFLAKILTNRIHPSILCSFTGANRNVFICRLLRLIRVSFLIPGRICHFLEIHSVISCQLST